MAADGSATCRFWALMHSERYGPIVCELTDDPQRAAFLRKALNFDVLDRLVNPLPPFEPKVVA